jgi:hypothetical protein
MKRRSRLTATTLRTVLSFSLLLIILLAAGGFSIANGWLRNLATDVSHATADASASHTTITTLEQLQETLAENREVIERANNIVAESQSYQYQDQIIQDLNNYAAAAGLTLINFNFSTQDSEAEPQEGQETTTQNVAPPSGINSTLVSVTIKNPVNYDNLLRFFYAIEQNLTKMQITNISLTSGDGSDVTSEALVIEVYIR